MSATIRAGRISAINYAKGMASILYADKNGTVSREIAFLSGEYAMPAIGDMVLVAHLDTDTTRGAILGRFFSEKNTPSEGKAGLYRKELDRIKGKAIIRYTPADGLSIHAPTIALETADGNITVANLLKRISDLEGKVGSFQGELTAMDRRISALGG